MIRLEYQQPIQSQLLQQCQPVVRTQHQSRRGVGIGERCALGDHRDRSKAVFDRAAGPRFDNVGVPPAFDWYGIDRPRVDAGYQLHDSDWLVQVAGQVFLNDRRIAVERRNLIGALALSEPDVIAVAVPGTLYLFTPRGKLIEAMDRADDLPARLDRPGVTPAGTLVVQAGTGVFEADRQVTRWSAFRGGSARWARRDAVPRDLARRIAAEARHQLLTWERVLLDMHSGRLFGSVGILVFDIVAGVLVALGGTGLYIWLTTPGRPC